MTDAFVFDAIRTPRGKGKKDGSLHEVKPIDLLAGLLRELQRRSDLDTARVDDVVMGVVSPVGEQGSVLPKIAALKAGWDWQAAGVQINRFCASGLEAVNLAAMKVRSGWEDLVVAGGVESMSRVPIGSDGGAWAMDPETNLQTLFVPQGIGADLIATLEGFSRGDVDKFALESQQRAARARDVGYFDRSVVPVRDALGQVILACDEFIKPNTTLEGLAQLKPSFEQLGAMGFDAVAQQRYPQVERIESRALARVMTTPVARNMVNTFFFDLNAVKSGQSRPKDVPRFTPRRVGILGAGMMGAGITWAQAIRGIHTIIKDVTQAKAEHGKAYSVDLSAARVAKGRMSEHEQAALLARIDATERTEDLRGCELIIEAVFENRGLKAQVTKEAEPMLAEGGFFASNTSTLPITGLATASARPQKFIGIHFFSPVDKMQLVEIIRGRQTDDETVARAYDYVRALGKLPIVVRDARGFYTSRTFGTFVMEGAAMLGEGIPAAVIENAAVQAGMPVGPLAVLDETSLALSVHVLDQTREDFAAEGKTYTPTPGERLVERMVKELGRAGRAAGGGFYDYPAGAKKHLWPELKPLFEKPGVAWDLQTLKDRLLWRQAIETARCLAEGVLHSVHEANVGSIFGIGFPAWTGGALQFIYGMGVDAFLDRAAQLAAAHGRGFAISAEVREAIRAYEPRCQTPLAHRPDAH